MPLTGKYLKYSPEITLEIFTLVWNKLIDSGINAQQGNDSVKKEYTHFSDKFSFLRLESTGLFGAYTKTFDRKETTVQEILGYDPFVKDELVQTSMSQHDACNTCKFYNNCDNAPEDCTAVNGQHYPKNIIKDDFVLPEKWKVKINNSNSDIISKYLKTLPYVKLGYDIYGFLISNPGDGSYLHYGDASSYTEITFEQFQKYVLNTEQPKVMEKSYNTIGKEELLDWSKATEKELLEEAKRRYPVGTVFSPAHINSKCRCIVTNFNFVTTKRQSKTIGVAILTDDKEYYSGDIKYGDTAYDRFVYSDGKWAEIISLPETKVESKEVIPEYVECIKTHTSDFPEIGNIFKVAHGNIAGICGYDSEFSRGHFKPSTKEAFDAQNKPKSIEKWSVGSYIVFLQDEVLTRSGRVTKGKPYVLTESGRCPYFKDDNINQINFDSSASESYGLKWFATLYEAEEFAKTLVKPFKQAVHCKTQEEWNFVTEKLGYKWTGQAGFNIYKIYSYINLTICTFGSIKGYDSDKILSFQEWCDLHGYKMEKEVKFEVGDWVIITKSNQNWNDCMDRYVGKVVKITSISSSTSIEFEDRKHWSFLAINGHFRHATPEEINNYLVSIGQIPTIEGINKTQQLIKQLKLDALSCMTKHPYYGVIENPCKDVYSRGQFSHDIKVPESSKPKMTLSIDDEELPMISIIKTNVIKQLLNLE